MTITYVLRLWLPDRPGALGAVASRVGAVGGDVVGIDILERGAGRAIDELVVELPDTGLVDLLIDEVQQVDGVDVEDVRRSADALHDPRLDALETAAILVGATTATEAIGALCTHAARTVGASWVAVVTLDTGDVIACEGDAPDSGWIMAFVEGSQSSARANGDAGADRGRRGVGADAGRRHGIGARPRRSGVPCEREAPSGGVVADRRHSVS